MSDPLVLVTVGTDHHPFDRLVGWVDAWLAGGGAERASCVVQHGKATPPSSRSARLEAVDYLEHDALSAYVARAAVVVSHGGPATITECRRAGRIPIVVPRRASLGEHVDDHQMLFTARLADRGHVVLVQSGDELARHLDAGVADPSTFAAPSSLDEQLDDAVRRFAGFVADLQPRGKR